MSVQLASGQWRGNREDLRRAVIVAVGNGAFQGMLQTITLIQPKIAQQTGNFRNTLALAAINHIQQQMGETQIRLNIETIVQDMMATLDYAEYHIDGKPHHPGDLTPYAQPSTPGTAPLDTKKFEETAAREIQKSVNSNLRASGLDFLVTEA